MTFKERYNLKEITVDGHQLMQLSTSFWLKKLENKEVFICWNDEKKHWSACIQQDDNFIEFRNKELQASIKQVEFFLQNYH